MRFNENLIKDRRTRFYLPVQRVLLCQNCEKTELLIGNTRYQQIMHYLPEMISLPPGASMVLDFGAAFHGGIRILSNAWWKTDDVKLHIQFGESVSEALGQANEDHSRRSETLSIPRGSAMTEYGNTVFRFVRIENVCGTDVRIQNIIGVALECDLEVEGSFESSDPRLNKIWKTAVRTVHLCMMDYLYDGAKRDRIVWMGDMHPEIKGLLCAFSDVSIVRDSFEFLIQQANADQPMNQIYTYSCWFIIGVWDYYCATGDQEFLVRHADYLRLMLDTYAGFIGPDGSEQVPERRFLDWANNDNPAAKHAGIQALLLWMMQSGEKILRELGLDASKAAAAQRLLKKHVPDPDGRKASAALLTLSGLADRRDVLEQNPFRDVSTFYGYYMLLAKDTVPALELIRRYWGAMLDFGATSFWEDFDLDWTVNASRIDEPPVPGKADIHADFGKYCYKGLRHSLSHGWSCGPAPFLSERVLGVRFPEPGKVAVRPDLGGLEYVCGKVPTPFGPVEVEADRSGKCKVLVPDGMTLL